MKWSSAFLGLLGVGMAFVGAMLIMPPREMLFLHYRVELPGITLLLLNSPWVTLLFPALTVVAALAARQNSRYAGKTCALGVAFLVLNVSLIVIFGYWPFRSLAG